MIQVGGKKFSIGAYITILIIVFILIIVAFLMFKYSVEGESRPPFIISKIIITSSAKTSNIIQGEAGYTASILQNNDIKIAIEKNENYKKEAKIRQITINNIQITDRDNSNSVEIYRPSTGEELYDYLEQNIVKDELKYAGGTETNIKADNLQVSNQGGILEFSVIQNNIGEMQYTENEQTAIDGTLLNKIGKTNEEIKFKLTFDMIIEIESGIKFKTTITTELPKGNIVENGVEIYEQTDFKAVFKRI